jgi:hypothetical protein
MVFHGGAAGCKLCAKPDREHDLAAITPQEPFRAVVCTPPRAVPARGGLSFPLVGRAAGPGFTPQALA